MKTTKDFVRKHPVDDQTLIRLNAGSEISLDEVEEGFYHVTAEKPCTKNGGNRFYLTDNELTEITS
jgi:hypothetical protein